MKKISKKNTRLLMVIGVLVISITLIITHYLKLSDFAQGVFMGIGLGLLFLSLKFGRFKAI